MEPCVCACWLCARCPF